MIYLYTKGCYDFYSDGVYYNIVPVGQLAPSGGYKKEYIEKVKGVKFK